MIKIIIFFSILLIAIFVRFYQLENIPAGLHGDAASQGYNAFSILHTGKDKYGESFPILFRSLGSYQPPLYTYLTIIPVSLFGNTVFSARFISAFCGVSLVVVTFLFINQFFNIKKKNILAYIGALTVALVPWSVFFSRLTVEANLGLLLFVTSMLFFVLSLKRIYLFPVACFILGLSTHAYYSERLISIIFIPVFILFYRKILFQNKRFILLGLGIFALLQIPHILILQTGALTRRFDQVSYIDNQSTNNIISMIKVFISNFFVYYSPKNLFFDSDTSLGRTMPGLSVFYSWFLIPLFIGIRYLLKNRLSQSGNLIWLLLIITPIPAGLTGDFFYPLRTLDFLWAMTLVISVGIFHIFNIIKIKAAKIFLSFLLIIYSSCLLYISYFVLFKYEKSSYYGYAYIKLIEKLAEYKNKEVVIDTARDSGIGIRMAYLLKYDPNNLQQQLRSQMKTPYYSSIVNNDEIYNIDNIRTKAMDWGEACKSNLIMVGDTLAISDENVTLHKLQLEFEVKDLAGIIALRGFSAGGPDCLSKNE